MVARLGHVLYWLCCIVAAIILAAFVARVANGVREDFFDFFLFVIIAFVVWLIGRAIRYVLAGT